MGEATFQQGILSLLELHFVVRRQVGGTHFTGRRFLLDAVVTPREPSL